MRENAALCGRGLINGPLLIIYLSAIETLIYHTEIEVNRVYIF